MSEPTEVSSQLEPTELPRKSSQLSLSEPQPQSPKLLVGGGPPKKALQLPESGSLQRKPPAPWQSDHPHRAQGSGGALGKQLQSQGLPRTVSEPEFPLFPGTQPHWQPQARSQRRPEAEVPSKARLPASVSESSLPSAMGVLGRHKPGALPSGGSRWSLQAGPPPQRPLPSLTSLGPPPAKPPLPPGLRNIQRFRSYLGPISGGFGETQLGRGEYWAVPTSLQLICLHSCAEEPFGGWDPWPGQAHKTTTAVSEGVWQGHRGGGKGRLGD